jgi:MerT mercuric transport protein.
MRTDLETSINSPSWLGIGAVLAAIGASACCVGPLLFLSLGIGGAWMSTLTAMEPARPFFIILALVLMALGYRKLYRKPSCCEESAICTNSDVQRKQRLIFWLGSAFILLLLAFPWLAPFFMA